MQNGQIPAVKLDPEVTARPRRRMFTAEYKKGILAEIDTSSGWRIKTMERGSMYCLSIRMLAATYSSR
ncbi:MAG: hypothetical protein SFV18_01215 [Bryobacteraceae bacterium]|nr:hypothetical protein [Bryobacteraceae bacterium]